jgi:16S rRNA processing protein RimM
MADTTELVAIGQIVKPFGLKGDVRVRSLSDVPGRFEGLKQVTLVAPTGRTLATVVNRVREDGAGYVIGFEAFSTPEDAAVFRGGLIQIPRDESPPLPAGQYYEFDLVGMTVADESGRELGTLEEILETGAHHVFIVRQGERERLIPARRDVIASVDVEHRSMTVRIEGLLDE